MPSHSTQQMVLREFFTFLVNIQLYHWITRSHARHEASGELYDSMSSLIDQFVEVYVGSTRLPRVGSFPVPVSPLKHREAVNYLKAFNTFLNDLDLNPTLANLRDEMSAQVARALYKFAQH
jgi:hypothetical protein